MKYALKLSREGKDAIDDYVQSVCALACAPIESKAAAEAHINMMLRKKDLIEYVSRLERTQRIPQEVLVIHVPDEPTG